uniref:Uncharacterized protein n=1 Tax=Arundo donax TaxID=35708 RepID=A0A0A9A5F1_ARUDO
MTKQAPRPQSNPPRVDPVPGTTRQ